MTTITEQDLAYKVNAKWFSPSIQGGAVCITDEEVRAKNASPVLKGYIAESRGEYFLIGEKICYSHKHGGVIQGK